MEIGKASFDQLSVQRQIQAQNIGVNSNNGQREFIKVYCENVFLGIAEVEQGKEGHYISERSKESIKVLTGNTDKELCEAFKVVEALSQKEQTASIDTKLSNITLFIEQINANPRLKAHITKCDVDNLLDQIEKLEKLDLSQAVKNRLTACRSMISAFKMDHVLLSGLKDNNAFNLRYYNDGLRNGEKRLEKMQTVLAQAEEGPVVEQLEDLHRSGKLKKEEGMNLSALKHGDVVCFERYPGQKYGEHAIVFAVVDLIGNKPVLHTQNANKNGTTIMVPQEQNMKLTRLHL